LPANPTKPGYKFKGWKVRPQYDFTTLPTDHTAAAGYGLGTGYYVQRVNGTTTEGSSIPDVSGFTDLNRNEWKSIFSWGTIYGMAKCSSIQGTSEGEHGTPNDTYGKYCWCHATGYIPNGQSTKYSPLKPTNWTFNSSCEVTSPTSGNLVNICNSVCAGQCAIYVSYATHTALLNGLLR